MTDCSILPREFDHKHASEIAGRNECDLTAVNLGDPLGDREAEAGAACFRFPASAPCLINAVKTLENVLLFLGRDSDAVACALSRNPFATKFAIRGSSSTKRMRILHT